MDTVSIKEKSSQEEIKAPVKLNVIFDSKDSLAVSKPVVSIVLLDWSCRESFHSIHYLNVQTVPRHQYELIWIEYYQRKSSGIENHLQQSQAINKPPVIDQWIVMGMPPQDIYYHKHLMYNIGIVRSRGDIVVICDSDAIFKPTFVETIIRSFQENPKIVLHLDEVRNVNQKYYPFCYPSIEEVLEDGCINWKNGKTTGLHDEIEPIHTRNYGACMAACRADLVAIGGADEHLDYLGHICGPYEMTFRLANYGREEVWHQKEFLYHTWHPGTDGINNFMGPHDGRNISTTALEVLRSKRILPLVENPAVQALRKKQNLGPEELDCLLVPESYCEQWSFETISQMKKFKLWHKHELVGSHKNFNLIHYKEKIYAVPQWMGPINLGEEEEEVERHPIIMVGETKQDLKKQIDHFPQSWFTPKMMGEYKGCNLVRYGRLIYGVPQTLGPINFKRRKERRLLAALCDYSVEDVKNLIDKTDLSAFVKMSLGSYRGYDLIRYRGQVYGIPQHLKEVDLYQEDERKPESILFNESLEEVKLLINLHHEMSEILSKEKRPAGNTPFLLPRLVGHYKGFNLVYYGSQFYGVPLSMGSVDLSQENVLSAKEVLSAPLLKELKREIDERIRLSKEPVTIISAYKRYNLLSFAGQFYAAPQRLGAIDLTVRGDRQRPGILCDSSLKNLKLKIKQLEQAVKIEFGGWLPCFRHFGNCGMHPQFAHTKTSPLGYQFVRSERNLSLKYTWRWKLPLALVRAFPIAWSVLIFFLRCWLTGAKPIHIFKFLYTRDWRSQFLIPARSKLVFLPSVPFTYNQCPWVLELEDTISLFFPFLDNGNTVKWDPNTFPYMAIYKTLLESKSCRGIVTHVRSTAENLPRLLKSGRLAKKITYVPLGISVPSSFRKPKRKNGELYLLFNNSFHQDPNSFYSRGGLDVLRAFYTLQKKYSHIKLIFRSGLPDNLNSSYLKILRSQGVYHIERFLGYKQWELVMSQADIYVLPSDRIHVVSLLQAMAYRMALVTTDGWAIQEYIEHGRNGLIVKGRYGKVTWMEQETGVLRENHEVMRTSDPEIVNGLVSALSLLIENKELRERLADNARRDVETKFNLDNWNQGLKQAFDQALGKRN